MLDRGQLAGRDIGESKVRALCPFQIYKLITEESQGNESCVLEVPDKEINKLHRLGNDPEENIGEFRQSVNNLVSSDFKEIEKIEKCDLTEIRLVSTSEENVNRVLEDVYETANPESIT